MDQLLPHEEVQESLVQWKPGMVVSFMSHTWLRYQHPDNVTGDKFALLKAIVLRAVQGELRISTYYQTWIMTGDLAPKAAALKQLASGYVWLDFLCIPQAASEEAIAARIAAIGCITEYISRSAFFIVLAGPWKHDNDGSVRDVRAWASRGWCRLEQLANAFSPSTKPKPMIVAQSPTDLMTYSPSGLWGRSCLLEVVGAGNFTVAADAQRLGPVILAMIERRKAIAAEGKTADELLMWRVLHVCTARLLRGTGIEPPTPEPLDAWMGAMRFKHVREGTRSGLTPLFFAVLGERTDLATELIARGASVKTVLRHAHPQFDFIPALPILHFALSIRCSVPMAELLMGAGGDPAFASGMALPGLFLACFGGSIELIDLLLGRRPELWDIPNRIGEFPAMGVLYLGRESALRHMIETYPKFLEGVNVPDGVGSTYAAWAIAGTGDVNCLRLILENGADPNLVGKITSSWKYFAFLGRLIFRLRRQKASQIIEMIALLNPSPPLHIAAFNGNLGACEALLAHKADPSNASTSKRSTPLHIAAMRGHSSVCTLLLSHGANAAARDAYGRCPYDWAAKRGHGELMTLLQDAKTKT